MPIDLTLQTPGPFVAGGAVRVTVEWSCTDAPERIEARLMFRTSGKGTTDRVIAVIDTRAEPPTAGRWETTLRIPVDSPPSYDGRTLSIEWVAEANTGQTDDTVERDIVVSPTGRPLTPTAAT